ncbi:hypothetical protein HDU67_000741 [Dinochytrium kinnereticum]|nr:hypothetical protein HDU67_000741 [Dinochytrium kinnereticum]
MVDYEHFLSQLRQEEAGNLTLQLKSFLRAFHAQQRPIPEQRKAVARFLEHIYGESLQNPVFAEATEDDELENIREGWEKLLMIKIYDHVFGAPGTDENKMTQYLTRKIEQFSWIQERHLDLPFQIGASLEVAQAELLRVNGFRCPKDKLTILQNVIKMIADLIQKQQGNAGNDQLLPVLILAVIRSNPPALISNVKYIMRFRYASELEKGAVQFCLTSMMGAVSFVYNMKINSLTLSPEELRQYGGKLQPPPPRTHSRTELPSNTPPPLPPRASSSGVSPSQVALGTSPPSTSGKVNDLANTLYSSTLKMFDTTANVIKNAAETAAVTVDGFAQGLIERFKEDGTSVKGSTGSLDAGYPGGRKSLDGIDSETSPPSVPSKDRNWVARLSSNAANNVPAGHAAPLIPTSPNGTVPANPEYTNGPQPPHDLYERFSSAKDRETFEAALSDAERGVLEDYDLQLALALSISIEDRRAAGIDVPPSPIRESPTRGETEEGSQLLIDIDDKPKEPPVSTEHDTGVGGSYLEENDDFEIPLKSPMKKKSVDLLADEPNISVLETNPVESEASPVLKMTSSKTKEVPAENANEASLI